MNDERLAQLAEAAGLSLHWVDANGRAQHVAPDAQRALLEALGFPAQTPQQIADSLSALGQQQHGASLPPLLTAELGQVLRMNGHFPAHSAFQVILEDGRRIDGRLDDTGNLPALADCGYQQLYIGDQQITLAVAPPACCSVQELTGRARSWGITAQLYGLRRPGDAGLGDTQTLETLARLAGQKGADALAISPVHAMFAARPEQYSPYSPSSRVFFNVLHASPATILCEAAVASAVANSGLLAELQRLETLPLIDWPAVANSRQRLLRQLHDDFASNATQVLRDDFARFCTEGGDALTQHCRFEALHGHMLGKTLPGDWRLWPAQYRDPRHIEVARFASTHANEVAFHAFGQWLVARGLQRAQQAARDAGMGVGLIADLAVGADPCGSQAWSRQAELLPAVSVGAPPDILNRSGQNWGISAFSPTGLQQHGFHAFIEMLQANLAHAGGIRIDHVMGLQRLWVIPEGAPADAGAYLNYPLTDLLRLLALESWRHRALVIGEDLGTVPAGLHEELARRNILGMRVLLFEQRHGRFIPAQQWPRDALATTTTHDLPSISGWLQGKDIDWRQQAGHSDAERAAHDHVEREQERTALIDALVDSGQLPNATSSDEDCLEASIGFLGSTPAPLVLLPLEDITGQREQPNLPGPDDIHPNWRRRQQHPVEILLDQPDAARRLARLHSTRQEASHE